jgi:hypothetical protein
MDADKEKKKLEDEWVAQAIDMMIGPHLAILFARDEKAGDALMKIIFSAVKDLYEKNEYMTTNDWVVASCNRIWEMYNTFMTAQLIHRFDNGVPEKLVIKVVKGNGSLN